MEPQEPHDVDPNDDAGGLDVRRRVHRVLALLSVASRAQESGELEVRDAEGEQRVASMVVQDGRLYLVRGAGDDGAIHDILRRWSPGTLDVLRTGVYAARTDGRPLEAILAEAGGRHLEVVRAALEQVLCRQLLDLAARTAGRRLLMPFRPLAKARGIGLAFDPAALYRRIVAKALPEPSGPAVAHYERVRDLADLALLAWLDPSSGIAALPLKFQGFEGMGLSGVKRIARSISDLARPPSLLVQGIEPESTVLGDEDGTWLCLVAGQTVCLSRHAGARAESVLDGAGGRR